MTWAVQRHALAPSEFHALALPQPVERAVWINEARCPALVLGSTQSAEVVDRAACTAAGVEVVRRHSGGGAVLVVPGDVVWVDVLLPAGDELWRADVGAAFTWVGELWAAALADLGLRGEVHLGPLRTGRWGREVCFAGLGPGEVTVAGRKVVGVAQRRTRAGARFQSAALRVWDPAALLSLLRLPPEALGELAAEAAGTQQAGDAVVSALLRHLP